jgi:DNA primase
VKEVAVDSAVEQIKERVPILELVGQRVKLLKSGRNFKGLCPFHGEKTPSFYVFPDRENWHCFGCGLGGDVFSFVMRSENVEFAEALRLLAARAGVELAPRGSQKAEEARESRLYEINAAAARYFQAMLFGGLGAPALEYLLGRGLTRETIESFGLGWAPDSWDALLHRLGEQGYPPEELAELGLVAPRESGGHYDRFRARIVFPIHDASGRVIGFGGRAMPGAGYPLAGGAGRGEAQPKYLNSTDTPVFSKGSALYAIDRARGEIKRAGAGVVVEGYMDALAAHQAGIANVVASLGTALTEQHFLTLKRLAPRVVLALDADAAGDAAALRTLEVLRGTYGRMAVPIADRRGLVRLRRDQELDVRVARLPQGMDPDDLIRRSPDEFRQLVAEAKPIVEVLIEAEVASAGPDVGARARAADNVLDFLKDLPNPVLADQYTRLLAERLAVDYEALRARLAAVRRAARRRDAAGARPEPPVEEDARLRDWLTLEEYVLRLLVLHPARAGAVLADLDPEDFYRVDARAIFEAVRDELTRGAVAGAELVERLEEPLAEHARWIVGWGADLGEPDDALVEGELLASALRLRLLNHHREIAMIAVFRRDLDREGDMSAWPQQSRRVAELLARIRELERQPGVRYAPPWMAIIRGEADLGPMRTLVRSAEPRPEEPPATAAAAAG